MTKNVMKELLFSILLKIMELNNQSPHFDLTKYLISLPFNN